MKVTVKPGHREAYVGTLVRVVKGKKCAVVLPPEGHPLYGMCKRTGSGLMIPLKWITR